ncbi:lysophospholipase [Azospirillum sp.]|uniref:alpha/beta hydrolase n=1 Tax=Azospirillum sp. TaxID=34012 RepID=UPI003D72437E
MALRDRIAALAVAAAVLAGCAANYQPMGTSVTPARMTDTAIIAADGVALPLRSWLPEQQPVRAAVVALHGFNDYSKAFEGTGRSFADYGIATYAYDQRGFGAGSAPGIWAGKDTMVADAHAAVELVRAKHPDVPVYLMGESMGGAVTLATLTRRDAPKVDGAILVAPAVWGRETMGFFPRAALWISYNLVPGMTVTAPKGLKIQPSDNIEMLRALGRDPLVIKGSRVDALEGLTDLMDEALQACDHLQVPTLVLYGAHEQVLPPRPVKRAIAALGLNARHTVAVYPDGYHMLLRDLKGDAVVRDVASWIRTPDIPLASGADRAPRELVASGNRSASGG